jgi:hypothetical protein
MLTFKSLRAVALAFALFAGIVGIASADSIYTFDGIPNGTLTPLSLTSNGLTATFTSNDDPLGFNVYATAGFFKTLTGSALNAIGPGRVLTIGFSSTVDSVFFNFADNGGAPLVLNAYEGTSFVGTVSATPSVPAGFIVPEGTVSLSGASFNRVVMSTTAPVYSIDNLDVKTGAVATPEPNSLVLLCFGLAGLAILRYRKTCVMARVLVS